MIRGILIFSLCYSSFAKVYKNKKNQESIILKRKHKTVGQECAKNLTACFEEIKKVKTTKIKLDKVKKDERNCVKNTGKIVTLTSPSGSKQKFCVLSGKYQILLEEYNTYHQK